MFPSYNYNMNEFFLQKICFDYCLIMFYTKKYFSYDSKKRMEIIVIVENFVINFVGMAHESRIIHKTPIKTRNTSENTFHFSQTSTFHLGKKLEEYILEQKLSCTHVYFRNNYL